MQEYESYIAGEVLANEITVAGGLAETADAVQTIVLDAGIGSHCLDESELAMPSSTGAKKEKPMAKKTLAHFEKRLLDERKRVVKELGSYGEAFGATLQIGGRESQLVLLPHGRSGHRRHGAREGVPLRELRGAFPLAHR